MMCNPFMTSDPGMTTRSGLFQRAVPGLDSGVVLSRKQQMITFNLLSSAHTTMSIEPLREEINRIDREIIRLIAKRQALAEKIVRIKIEQGLSIHDEARVQEVLQSSFNYAVEHKINPVYVQKILQILIEMSEERQRECSGEGNLP